MSKNHQLQKNLKIELLLNIKLRLKLYIKAIKMMEFYMKIKIFQLQIHFYLKMMQNQTLLKKRYKIGNGLDLQKFLKIQPLMNQAHLLIMNLKQVNIPIRNSLMQQLYYQVMDSIEIYSQIMIIWRWDMLFVNFTKMVNGTML